MLVAAVVLVYVSYWLFSKVDVEVWQRFVREKIERAAASGSGLALASVAFLAVYREGFETVLFYKALYVTGGGGGAAPITAGLAAGAVVLVALYFGLEKFGIRIPLRPFFAVTGATLYFMAFVFAGAGVKELQEGALVRTTRRPRSRKHDSLPSPAGYHEATATPPSGTQSPEETVRPMGGAIPVPSALK